MNILRFFKKVKTPAIPDPVIDDEYLTEKQLWGCQDCEGQFLGKYLKLVNGEIQCPLCQSFKIQCIARNAAELRAALNRGK